MKILVLQMQYKHLKEEIYMWRNDDIGYLKQAKAMVSKKF